MKKKKGFELNLERKQTINDKFKRQSFPKYILGDF